MSQTANPDHARVQPVIAGIAVRLQIPLESMQELLRTNLLPVRLVFIECNWMLRIYTGSVKPYIALRLSFFPRLVEYLKRSFISMQILIKNFPLMILPKK